MTDFNPPVTIKATYILAVLTMIVGMMISSQAMMSTAVIVLVVLSVGVHILEALHDLTHNS